MQQNGIGYADHPYLSNQNGVMHGFGMKNPSQRRRSISETKDGHHCEVLCSLFIKYSNHKCKWLGITGDY